MDERPLASPCYFTIAWLIDCSCIPLLFYHSLVDSLFLHSYQTARTQCVIGDPSYFPDKVKKVGQVQLRGGGMTCNSYMHTFTLYMLKLLICMYTHTHTHTHTYTHTHTHTDIYVSCVSYAHNVSSKGFYIAMVSTTVETSEPEKERAVGLELLGPVLEK